MRFIALNLIVAVALLLMGLRAEAGESPPRILREPLLGMEYDRIRVKFEPVPRHVLSTCPTLAPRERWKPIWYIFGKAESMAHGTFYVVGGYSVRTHPDPPEIPKYDRDDPGVIFSIKEGVCTVFEEAAREMFEPYLTGEIPDEVLRALAMDNAHRLIRTFGEKRIRASRMAIDKLPPALREAYSAILK